MLVRIPDDYVCFLNLLNRNGIPYEILQSVDATSVSKRIDTLSEIGAIDLDLVNKEDLVKEAMRLIDESLKIEEVECINILNTSIRKAYNNIKYEIF